MSDQNSNRGEATKQILQEEDLPPDLLERALRIPEMQDGHLFEWVMQLQGLLGDEDAETVGDVVNDGVLIAASSSDLISRQVSTLNRELRSSLKEELTEETQHMERATFVLALDVQNQVHNKFIDQ